MVPVALKRLSARPACTKLIPPRLGEGIAGERNHQGLEDLIVESGLLNRISEVEGPPEVKETSSVVGSSRPSISKAAGVNLS